MGQELASGRIVAERYRLTRLLGQGGMGFVWEAEHLVTGRSVAMKFLRSTLSPRPEMRRRFLREARAAGTVNHANVVVVHDVFELEDATPVMVMALLRGETFGRRLAREVTISLADAADILLPVVSAVGTAHEVGIVHRDLKPENVFLANEGGNAIVKVLDFGIAKLKASEDPGDSGFTATGTMLGTPHYMAPEQGFGEKDIDHRADIWAIGAMLYEALVGGRPVEGNNLGQILKRFLTSGITPIDVLVPDLPVEVASLIMRMLAREREARPDDLREVHRVLSGYARTTVRGFGAPAGEPVCALKLAASAAPPLPVTEQGGDTLKSEPEPPLRAAADTELDTNGAHSVSVAVRRSSGWRRAVIGTAVAASVLAVWAIARPTSERAENRAPQIEPAPRGTEEQTAPPPPHSPTVSSALAESPTPPAPSREVARQPTARPAKTPVLPSDARLTSAKVAERPAGSAVTPSPIRPAGEGLYEQPPF